MKTTTTSLKISSFVDQTLLPNLKCLCEDLRSGDLLSFEEGLIELLGGFYDQLCEQVLKDCSEELASSLKKQAYDEGCRKLIKRPIKFRLLTGHFVELDNYYIGSKANEQAGKLFNFILFHTRHGHISYNSFVFI